MIYELAYVLRTEATEEAQAKLSQIIKETISDFKGELFLEDNWGVKTFAQPTKNGISKGNYQYLIFKGSGHCNNEIERRLRISEDILKFIFVNLGNETEKEAIVKGYKNPAQAATGVDVDSEKDKKMFSKRKSCWFSAKKTAPDWKDPSSYSWLVNEFGKISPARVTGLRPKFQRMSTTAIKRGRCMGMISFMSNETAR